MKFKIADLSVWGFSNISTYRTHLMGFAILGVMVGHIRATNPSLFGGVFDIIVHVFSHSLFTETFLFLSGLGLYASFKNNNSVLQFYKRRLKRLFFPYLFIAGPFFIILDLICNGNVLLFFSHISTLYFFFGGNYYGMWYISVILLLYLLYPFIHNFLYNTKGVVLIKLLFILFIILLLRIFIFSTYQDYYNDVEIGIDKISMFFVGSYFMYKMKEGISVYDIICYSLIFILFLYLGIVRHIHFFIQDIINCSVIISILLYTLLCYLLQKKKNLLSPIEWMGKYSLELYILHLLIYYVLCNINDKFMSSDYYMLISVCVALIACQFFNCYSKDLTNYIIK